MRAWLGECICLLFDQRRAPAEPLRSPLSKPLVTATLTKEKIVGQTLCLEQGKKYSLLRPSFPGRTDRPYGLVLFSLSAEPSNGRGFAGGPRDCRQPPDHPAPGREIWPTFRRHHASARSHCVQIRQPDNAHWLVSKCLMVPFRNQARTELRPRRQLPQSVDPKTAQTS